MLAIGERNELELIEQQDERNRNICSRRARFNVRLRFNREK
jgi:hypothetical protein